MITVGAKDLKAVWKIVFFKPHIELTSPPMYFPHLIPVIVNMIYFQKVRFCFAAAVADISSISSKCCMFSVCFRLCVARFVLYPTGSTMNRFQAWGHFSTTDTNIRLFTLVIYPFVKLCPFLATSTAARFVFLFPCAATVSAQTLLNKSVCFSFTVSHLLRAYSPRLSTLLFI